MLFLILFCPVLMNYASTTNKNGTGLHINMTSSQKKKYRISSIDTSEPSKNAPLLSYSAPLTYRILLISIEDDVGLEMCYPKEIAPEDYRDGNYSKPPKCKFRLGNIIFLEFYIGQIRKNPFLDIESINNIQNLQVKDLFSIVHKKIFDTEDVNILQSLLINSFKPSIDLVETREPLFLENVTRKPNYSSKSNRTTLFNTIDMPLTANTKKESFSGKLTLNLVYKTINHGWDQNLGATFLVEYETDVFNFAPSYNGKSLYDFETIRNSGYNKFDKIFNLRKIANDNSIPQYLEFSYKSKLCFSISIFLLLSLVILGVRIIRLVITMRIKDEKLMKKKLGIK